MGGWRMVVGVDQALRFTSQYRFLHFMVLGRRVVNTLYKLSSYVVSLTCVLMELIENPWIYQFDNLAYSLKVYDFDKLTLGLEHRVVVDFGMWELGVEGNFVGYYRHDVVCDSVIVSARYQDFEVIGMIQRWNTFGRVDGEEKGGGCRDVADGGRSGLGRWRMAVSQLDLAGHNSGEPAMMKIKLAVVVCSGFFGFSGG
ncbi:hypothetical protein FXO38_01185 [Capsicum annuum]|nr:hypothetical protein FXO37_20002 [Capsicum annuum]KAF3682656.1 hypothetical protein FXO38_01185 [Capsicum annuum]